MKSFLARLAALEASSRQDPLIVLAEDDDEIMQTMTVQAMLDSGRGFVRVASGSSLKDLDRLLMAFHERALQAFDGGEA